jgi:ADP-ribose pyrophosphatase YjhB (NUDIX family)
MDRRAPKLVADVAVIAAGQVLLVRYRDTAKYDGQSGWFLPDDFLEHGEHPADAADRILREQSGLPATELRLSHIESFANGAWHLIFHFVTEVAAPVPVSPSGNVLAAEWFPLDALPPSSEMAHDGWAGDVVSEIERLSLTAAPSGGRRRAAARSPHSAGRSGA